MSDALDVAIQRAGRTQGSLVLGKGRGEPKIVHFDMPLDLSTEDLLEMSSLIGSHVQQFLALERQKASGGLVVARPQLVKPS